MDQRRLSIRHLPLMDQAFERHARIQILDDELFGQNVPAIANPYQGTMTAGDLHFGLYRQPPMWRMSDTSLDTLILIDPAEMISKASRFSNGNELDEQSISSSSGKAKYRFMQQRKLPVAVEDNCICCVIS
ncbi:hypothetical protein MUCCIDRAFT_106233 [Mucor lusitanicus CBS 277.49]|uniref:Uncharacterized protein n=1 Tax=Mucor lusitanicus CBS 277.49 TaxID=747725 RepID=A0A168N1Y5_MUCCL|nr:hypothetical protein MUCCIDRAFT_106233 [Mucor lusitanicus CBS 277.49]